MSGVPLTVLLLTLACVTFLISVALAARRWAKLQAEIETARTDARLDTLTGRPNRRALDEALATLGDGQALLFADLDNFKAVNDAQGHTAGDALLRTIATSWPGDAFICRYGGDEFVAVTPVLKAERLANEMLEATARVGGGVTLSIGLARGDPATLLLRADRALGRAKARGGNVVVYDKPILTSVRNAA